MLSGGIPGAKIMKIADAMTRTFDLTEPSASVKEAATKMAELDVGGIFVGTAEAIEGVLTDRDIIVRVVVEGLHPAEVNVRDVMTADVETCRDDDEIEKVFAAMREGQFRRMPVLDQEGKLVGIVTLSDLARHVESPEKVAEKLREISEPHRSREAPEDDAANTDLEPETGATAGAEGQKASAA
jgi:CBS domain-containing protein